MPTKGVTIFKRKGRATLWRCKYTRWEYDIDETKYFKTREDAIKHRLELERKWGVPKQGLGWWHINNKGKNENNMDY